MRGTIIGSLSGCGLRGGAVCSIVVADSKATSRGAVMLQPKIDRIADRMPIDRAPHLLVQSRTCSTSATSKAVLMPRLWQTQMRFTGKKERRVGTMKPADQYADQIADSAVEGQRSSSGMPIQPSQQGFWLPVVVIGMMHHLVNVAALINVIVYPALLAFAGGVSAKGNNQGWYALLMLLDFILWLDLISRFFTPMWDPEDEDKRILSHRRVLRHRTCGRAFVYDLVCRFPYELTYSPLSFRYGHLLRMMLAPRALSITNDPLGRGTLSGTAVFVNPSQRLARLLFASLLGLHWYGCITWHVAERLEVEAGESTWLTVTASSGIGPWQTWPAWARYVRSLQFATKTMIGEGDGGVAHAEKTHELVALLIGIIWMSYFTSTMVNLVTTLNMASERSLEKISMVKTFCMHANLSPELQARVMRHLEHVLLVRKLTFDWHLVLRELSAPLRSEVSLQRCKAFLMSPKFIGMRKYQPRFLQSRPHQLPDLGVCYQLAAVPCV